MLIVIVNWIYVLITTTYIIGFSTLQRISGISYMFISKGKKKLTYNYKYRESTLIAGLLVVNLYAEFFSIIGKVSIAANLLLIFTCVLLFFEYKDGIVASQTGASDDYVHNCVLRSLLHGTAPADGLGDALGLMSEGDKKTATFNATIAGNPSATRIVVYLMDDAGGLNNVASCMAGESLPYAYEK